MSIQHCPGESKPEETGGCQYLGRIERQHASLGIPPEGKEECGAGISIEKV